jgi:glycosyltransferase involved in cell wall biosynthesis
MTRRLRIAQLAPIATRVAPGVPDSIGQLVSGLTEELMRRGHDVTLFATGDSLTSARLHSIYDRGYEADGELWDWQFHEVMHASRAFEHPDEFDVIHSHAYHFALPFARLAGPPVVHTYHVWMDPDIARSYAREPRARLLAISDAQRRSFAGRADVPVIHHGIDVAAFPFSARPGRYLAYLGRVIADKGAVEAIAAARRAGMPLVLAGPYETESDYFATEVAPHVDGDRVHYAGPLDAAQRDRLLAGAGALLYPIAEPEPFGLVKVEAMACGTPVVAVGLGAVPEIVDQGVTGYHCPDPRRLADLIGPALALDRTRIRRVAQARFDLRRMVDDHERLYRRLVAEAEPVAGLRVAS